MAESNRFASIALLGWNFFLHVIRRRILRRKSPGYKQFIENYREDRIVPFSQRERGRLAEYGKCISCGLCDPVCPSLRAAGRSRFAGPMDLAMCVSRDPSELGVAPDPFRSVLCEACDRACPEGVPVAELVTYMRRKARQTHPEMLPAFYAESEKRLADTGNVFGAKKLPAFGAEARILYWRGCREAASAGSGNGKTPGMALLEKLGVSYKSIEENCCGGLPSQMGLDYDASGVMESINAAEVDMVVTGCPLCLRALRKAMPLIRVRHVLNIVADRLAEDMKPLAGRKAAFHDPCLLGRALNMYDLPREIIAGLGGEIVPLPRERDNAPCCGAGGAVPEVDPDLAVNIARDRIDEVVDSGAAMLLTSCDECAAMFRKSLRDGETLEIYTLMEIILKAGS